MRALTIHQPFASLIMAGAKPFEFRGRRPPAALVGQRIVVHASAQNIRQPFAADLFVAVRDQALSSIITATLDPAKALPVLARAWEPAGEPVPMSAGLGTVIIGEPRRATEIAQDPGYPLADDEQDLWAWPMLDIQRWPVPVAQAGAQGFWTWPPCERCMGTGYSDYAGFAQDLCAHDEPLLSSVGEGATKKHGRGYLTRDDCKALALMGAEPTVLSIDVARLFGPWNRTATLRANAMLARLQRLGLAEREPYRPGFYSQWRITDAGRQAVSA